MTEYPPHEATPMTHAQPKIGQRPEFWLLLAIICGSLPLVLGLSVFGAYRATRMDLLLTIGGAIIIAGLSMAILGAVSIVMFIRRARLSQLSLKQIHTRSACASALLFSNFPVALFCILITAQGMSIERIDLTNDSPNPLRNVVINWPGGEITISELGPGQTTHLELLIQADGAVQFAADRAGQSCSGTLIGYVTPNAASDHRLSILTDCSVRALE
jgi:hypothetical protein